MSNKRSVTPSAQGANFVTAHEPPQRQAPTTQESVNAKWKDNAGMWIGVFVVLVGAQWIVWLALNVIGWSATWYPPLMAIQQWSIFAFFAGSIAFGWLMMWRSALDEREKQGAYLAMQAEIDELAAELEEADTENADLRMRLDRAQVELREQYTQMQGVMAQQRQFVPQAPAASAEKIPAALYRDATFLAELSYTPPYEYARDKVMFKHGWGKDRWYAARDVLVAAGIWRMGNKTTEKVVEQRATAMAMLALYAGHNEDGKDS